MKSLLVVSSGKDLASRERARRLRASLVVGEPVSLDFAGVRTLTQSFADELIGALVARQGLAWFRENIRLENLSPSHRLTILQAVQARLDRAPAEALAP